MVENFPSLRSSGDSFAGIDLAFFSAGAGTSKQFAPIAQRAGAIVIDNSSAFRMDEMVPLIIPEINPGDIRDHHGIIANPNCTTAVALMALYPLHRAFGLRRVFAASYQAVSGSGARAIEELQRQVEAAVRGGEVIAQVYPHPIAFNVAAACRFLSREWLHQGRNEDAKRRPQDHAPAGFSRLGHLRAGAGLPGAFGRHERGI